MIRRLLLYTLTIVVILTACSDNESFSSSAGNRLTFSQDTISFDTLFSAVPSATRTFWVYNDSGDGIRIRTARLERSGQSGYRVNVDGTYLDPVGTDFEIRKGDSILVFVEVTTHENHIDGPQLVEDNLLLTLESGVEQRVNLRTYSWDAQKVSDLVISRDTLIESSVPIIFYGKGIEVAEHATLTLRNSTFYFHDGAGISVKGQLVADSCIFRGDRLDRMFDYLPYDRIPAQWEGVRFDYPSLDNELNNCEIRNAVNAVVCDSSFVFLSNTIIHNSGGYGLAARNSVVTLLYCQLTNSYGDCLLLSGGDALVDHCTLAQFFSFSANRGVALRFTNTKLPLSLLCTNTLVTGYDDDVVMGPDKKDTIVAEYRFVDCLMRTPAVSDSTRFERVIWETPKDSVQGKMHFRTIDEDKLYYDFTIDSISPAFLHDIGRIVRVP